MIRAKWLEVVARTKQVKTNANSLYSIFRQVAAVALTIADALISA